MSISSSLTKFQETSSSSVHLQTQSKEKREKRIQLLNQLPFPKAGILKVMSYSRYIYAIGTSQFYDPKNYNKQLKKVTNELDRLFMDQKGFDIEELESRLDAAKGEEELQNVLVAAYQTFREDNPNHKLVNYLEQNTLVQQNLQTHPEGKTPQKITIDPSVTKGKISLKTKLLVASAGLITLGTGAYLALSRATNDPVVPVQDLTCPLTASPNSSVDLFEQGSQLATALVTPLLQSAMKSGTQLLSNLSVPIQSMVSGALGEVVKGSILASIFNYFVSTKSDLTPMVVSSVTNPSEQLPANIDFSLQPNPISQPLVAQTAPKKEGPVLMIAPPAQPLLTSKVPLSAVNQTNLLQTADNNDICVDTLLAARNSTVGSSELPCLAPAPKEQNLLAPPSVPTLDPYQVAAGNFSSHEQSPAMEPQGVYLPVGRQIAPPSSPSANKRSNVSGAEMFATLAAAIIVPPLVANGVARLRNANRSVGVTFEPATGELVGQPVDLKKVKNKAKKLRYKNNVKKRKEEQKTATVVAASLPVEPNIRRQDAYTVFELKQALAEEGIDISESNLRAKIPMYRQQGIEIAVIQGQYYIRQDQLEKVRNQIVHSRALFETVAKKKHK